MIATAERPGLFERQDIGRLFDHAEQLDRAGRIRTDIAKLIGRKVAAQLARTNSAACFGNRARDLFGLIAARLHHPKCNSFGRTRTDPGHLAKLRDQIPQRGWIFRFSHTASPARTRALLTPASSAFRPDSAPAARGGGDITVAARRLPRSARAPFETPNTPRPIASRGKTRRRSRNNRAAPTVPAWPPPPARAVRKFRVARANSRR